MTVTSALTLAKDLAALTAGVSLLLAAAVLWSGAGGVTLALAASTAAVAVGGALAIVTLGAAAALGASTLWSAAAVAALCGAGAVYSAASFGARGLWIAALASAGAALALAMVAVFSRAGALGPAGPLVAMAGLSLLAAGALGAAAHAPAGPRDAPPTQALAAMFTPPEWFDCAYVALGGAGLSPERCATLSAEDGGTARISAALEPPRLPAPESEPRPLAPESAPVLLDSPRRLIAPPVASTAPDAVDATTPLRVAVANASPPTPEAPTPAMTSATIPPAPAAPDAPEPAAEPTKRSAAPALGAALTPPKATATPLLAPTLAPPPSSPTPPRDAVAPNAASADPDRPRSAYVCFSLLDAHADRLCPDARISPASLSVRWRKPGAEATALVEDVTCAIDRDAAIHATLVMALPADPTRPFPRGGGDATASPLGDALYNAVLGLVSAARADLSANTFYLSMHFPNGSRLAGAWASHRLGVGRSDRLFEVRSPGQTLAMIGRLKTELQAPRRRLEADALVAGLIEAATEQPGPTARAGQQMLVLVVDANSSAAPGEEAARRIAKASLTAEAPLFVIVLSADGAATEGFERLAEATGGAAFGASDAASLAAAFERVSLRARSFCAVRVTAPTRLFDEGDLEVQIQRRLVDGCELRQAATLSCGSVNMRVETE